MPWKADLIISGENINLRKSIMKTHFLTWVLRLKF